MRLLTHSHIHKKKQHSANNFLTHCVHCFDIIVLAKLMRISALTFFLLLLIQHVSAQHHHLNSLINDEDITHTAVADGSWFDNNTWANGNIPDQDAWVHIPAETTVYYDQINTSPMSSVLVDGSLIFAHTQSSQLIVDTLLINNTGRLIIGTENQPVSGNTSVEILFRDLGDIDVTRDPTLVGRGLVASGEVRIHGVAKTTHLKVTQDPLVGDNQVHLSDAPLNWSVGDRLIIAGTKYSGWKWDNDIQAVRYHGTQDEEVLITAVDGNTVSFNQPLKYDHFTPRQDLKTSVANVTRNIRFATLNPESTLTHRRGHVMFMGDAKVDVRYASFWQLGRTDKSFLTREAVDFDPILANSNVRGRYSFHLHRKGISNQRAPAIAIGNVAYGSPGWGYVHHDSHAIFHDNISYDTFGAGFVAETGNETGSWTNNLAIKAEGNSAFNPKNGNNTQLFDMGRTGDGFWFQGRMVRSVNNIAASVNHGFVYLHRGNGMISFPSSVFMLPEALPWTRDTSVDDAPILSFDGNESFASTVGVYVVKANPNQQHDIHSHFKNFKAWEVRAGAAMEYTSHYLLENFDIIGKTPEAFSTAAFGIEFGTNTSDMVINTAQIVDMPTGVILSKHYTNPDITPEANQYALIDVSFDNVNVEMEEFDASIDQVLSSQDLSTDQFTIDVNNGVYEYLSPATTAGSGVFWSGQKTDSIGVSPIPAGTDLIGVPSPDMIGICEIDGYYRSNDGTPYAIVEEYFTERATGQIHKLGIKMLLGPNVDALLGNQFHAWRNAFQAGNIDLNSQAPVAIDDDFLISSWRPTNINLLINDSDPESDNLTIDGIVQPSHGRVYDNQDGTVTYLSDFDYNGPDQLSYWVTDGHGNYSSAQVNIQVVNDVIFLNDFLQ